jgi:hypothetical protein
MMNQIETFFRVVMSGCLSQLFLMKARDTILLDLAEIFLLTSANKLTFKEMLVEWLPINQNILVIEICANATIKDIECSRKYISALCS